MNRDQIEHDLEDIKANPDKIYEKYSDAIKRAACYVARRRNLPVDELTSVAYIYYRELAIKYNPYYNGNYYPFDKYLFDNLYVKLFAYAQKDHLIQHREVPCVVEFTTTPAKPDDVDACMDITNFLSQVGEPYGTIIKMALQGYVQAEIAEVLSVSQSKICKAMYKARAVFTKQKQGEQLQRAALNIDYLLQSYKPTGNRHKSFPRKKSTSITGA